MWKLCLLKNQHKKSAYLLCGNILFKLFLILNFDYFLTILFHSSQRINNRLGEFLNKSLKHCLYINLNNMERRVRFDNLKQFKLLSLLTELVFLVSPAKIT